MQISRTRPAKFSNFRSLCTLTICLGCSPAVQLMLHPTQACPQTAIVPVAIQAKTHLVLVNVIVQDKHGRPVENLQRSDFTLLDNNHEQRIAFFGREDSTPWASGLSSASGPLTFTNRPPATAPAVTMYLFDELNTSLTDQELAKRDFLHYLQELPADSRVSVFVLGDSLDLLHDFSQDMTSLLAEINHRENRVNPEVAAATTPPPSAHSLTGGIANTSQWDSFMRNSTAPYVDYTKIVRASRTAEALQTIAGHVQGIPGPKTLIWISGGFPIELGLRNGRSDIPQGTPNGRVAGASSGRGTGSEGRTTGRTSVPATRSASSAPSSSAASNSSQSTLPGMGMGFEDQVARALRALNEADVAVYPVDAQGITASAAFEASRSSMGKTGRPTRGTSAPDYNYETLEDLAEQTGGLAFYHVNDLSSAIHDAARDARNSYSLAFYPTRDALDGMYHHLEVKVDRPDTRLRYRPGYFAAADRALAPQLSDAIDNPIALAGIGFNVRLEPIDGGYKASVIIDPRSITLDSKDGKWTGALQFLVRVGKTEQLTTIPLSFSEEKYREVQGKGLILGARIKMPPGAEGFSLGFRDIPSGIVGTLHVAL
jgi:VWFA-related protein